MADEKSWAASVFELVSQSIDQNLILSNMHDPEKITAYHEAGHAVIDLYQVFDFGCGECRASDRFGIAAQGHLGHPRVSGRHVGVHLGSLRVAIRHRCLGGVDPRRADRSGALCHCRI